MLSPRLHNTAKMLLFAATLVLASGCADGAGDQRSGESPAQTTGAGIDALIADFQESEESYLHRPSDRSAPGFTLTDQNGATVSLSDFQGKWVLVDWVYTKCLTVCPLLTSEMNIVRTGLGDAVGTNFQFLSITFDAESDTPAALKEHARRVGGDVPGWSWLTGTKAETDAVAASYGVSYDPAAAISGIPQFDHTSLLVIIDPDGRERHRYLGVGWAQDVLERLGSVGSEPDTIVQADPEPVSADDEPQAVTPEPSTVGGIDADLLSTAIALPWEEWELEEGVTSQVLYQFPSSGHSIAFVAQMAVVAEEEAESVQGDRLTAMTYSLIDWGDGRVTAVAYTDGALVLVVEGTDAGKVRRALAVVDDEWCCSSPE